MPQNDVVTLPPLEWRKWKPLPHWRKSHFRPLEERFWQYVQRAGANECWEWTRRCAPYGQISLGGSRGAERLYSHRASWLIHYGAIPDGKHVLHKCDNGRCVNPRHLFLGTQADNNRDRDRKGRGVKPPVLRGKDHPRQARKLTDAQVLEIRRSTEPTRILTARYGMSRSGINFIRAGTRWQHLGE
jgi:hypothetical protein